MDNRGPVRASTTSKRRVAKRVAAQRAAAQLAAARRRRRLAIGGVAAVVVAGLVVAILVGVGGGKLGKAGAPAASGPAASGPAASGPAAATQAVPPGVDPALGTKPVVEAGTGTLTKLTVTPLVEGRGPALRPGQNITVNYVGVQYPTGKEFGSSWSGHGPFSFVLGRGQVIDGWDQGLVGVQVGSRVRLDIPTDLAYGDPAPGGRPSGPLRFVVDVLSAE